jgi:hypothetical protein
VVRKKLVIEEHPMIVNCHPTWQSAVSQTQKATDAQCGNVDIESVIERSRSGCPVDNKMLSATENFPTRNKRCSGGWCFISRWSF